MLWLATALKLVAEIALLALFGRWLLGAWLRRLHPRQPLAGNPFYWLLDTLSRPFITLAGWLAPRMVLPQHHALVAFCLLLLLWLGATLFIIERCAQLGLDACR